MSDKSIYKVEFHGESEYAGSQHFYTSIAAIYDDFTSDELGIKVSSLRNAKASRRTYSNKLVMISRVRLHSKPNKAGKRASIPPVSDKPG